MLIPSRSTNVTGSQFANNNYNTDVNVREFNILNEIQSGNMPDFLRKFTSIHITVGNNSITYLTMPNYLSIGSDDDYLIIPMNAITAQKICKQFDCSLPTKLMVDQIWKQSINKLAPKPFGPPYDANMFSTARYVWSDKEIKKQMVGKDINKLTAGHKKDIIISNNLSPNNYNRKVCIYGWHNTDGTVIQGKNYFTHEVTYFDYSQTIRLIANDVIVNGSPRRLQDVFVDPVFCNLVSDEGIVTFLNY